MCWWSSLVVRGGYKAFRAPIFSSEIVDSILSIVIAKRCSQILLWLLSSMLLPLALAAVLPPRAVLAPFDDPFYTPPADLSTSKPGDILRSRQINNLGLASHPTRSDIPAALPLNRLSWKQQSRPSSFHRTPTTPESCRTRPQKMRHGLIVHHHTLCNSALTSPTVR